MSTKRGAQVGHGHPGVAADVDPPQHGDIGSRHRGPSGDGDGDGLVRRTLTRSRPASREVQQPLLEGCVLGDGPRSGPLPNTPMSPMNGRHGLHAVPDGGHQPLGQGLVAAGGPGDVPAVEQVVGGAELDTGWCRGRPRRRDGGPSSSRESGSSKAASSSASATPSSEGRSEPWDSPKTLRGCRRPTRPGEDAGPCGSPRSGARRGR